MLQKNPKEYFINKLKRSQGKTLSTHKLSFLCPQCNILACFYKKKKKIKNFSCTLLFQGKAKQQVRVFHGVTCPGWKLPRELPSLRSNREHQPSARSQPAGQAMRQVQVEVWGGIPEQRGTSTNATSRQKLPKHVL